MIPKSLLHHGIGGEFVVIIQKTKILLAPNRKKGFVSELKGCFGWDRESLYLESVYNALCS